MRLAPFGATAAALAIAGTVRAMDSDASASDFDDFVEIAPEATVLQGVGELEAGTGVSDAMGPGAGIGIDVSVRDTPAFGFGLVGRYEAYRPSGALARSGGDARGVVAGVSARFHLAPRGGVDPWISIGSGYRMSWVTPDGPGNDVFRHGFQLANVRFGVDLRIVRQLAISPFVGADANVNVWRRREAVGGVDMPAQRVHGFMQVGLSGRFDFGG